MRKFNTYGEYLRYNREKNKDYMRRLKEDPERYEKYKVKRRAYEKARYKRKMEALKNPQG